MRTHRLSISGVTLDTILGMAEQTGVHSEKPVKQVVLEALRLYQWLLRHQAAGRHIVVLEAGDLEAAELCECINGDREVLVDLRKRARPIENEEAV